ncbi:hypothetical protein V6N13_016910 [Hibiscus sabdariffa]
MQQSRQKAFIVFVENILKAMQWKGLWNIFARHGDVVGMFIANRLSRGKKFGFVRFEKMVDAERAIERYSTNAKDPLQSKSPQQASQGIGVSGTQFHRNVKKIEGHIEEEDLWKLKRCPVGEMETVCSEIFAKIDLWTEGSILGASRVTWVEVAGIPFHCWNHITLTRLAEL